MKLHILTHLSCLLSLLAVAPKIYGLRLGAEMVSTKAITSGPRWKTDRAGCDERFPLNPPLVSNEDDDMRVTVAENQQNFRKLKTLEYIKRNPVMKHPGCVARIVQDVERHNSIGNSAEFPLGCALTFTKVNKRGI
jgi:hypothetical protein